MSAMTKDEMSKVLGHTAQGNRTFVNGVLWALRSGQCTRTSLSASGAGNPDYRIPDAALSVFAHLSGESFSPNSDVILVTPTRNLPGHQNFPGLRKIDYSSNSSVSGLSY